jgi:hypothetical protein
MGNRYGGGNRYCRDDIERIGDLHNYDLPSLLGVGECGNVE